MKTVGEASELAGVTVRTLHYYDEVGLLSPSERS
jgi:MerR family transcriptional regulator, thiopeptide resistance regulator